MDKDTVLAMLQHYWEATDSERAHAIYHDDAMLEFPQSQERFEGKTNFIAWRNIYPAKVEFNIKRIRGQGNVWVMEGSLRYDDGPWNYGVSIHEFRDGKIARETIYFGERWEAPAWRAPWRAAWQAETWINKNRGRKMKTIGVLGGIGPQATMDFEQRFHRAAQQLAPPQGNRSYPPLWLTTIAIHPLRWMQTIVRNCRSKRTPQLVEAAGLLGQLADFLVITSNGATRATGGERSHQPGALLVEAALRQAVERG